MRSASRSDKIENPARARAQGMVIDENRLAPVEIGLINNMSGAALHSTSKQFCDLLSDAAQRQEIRVRIFSPFAHPRLLTSGRALSKQHEPIENLWTSHFDGLIVTGTEPKAISLVEEPCLPFLRKLVEWADDNVLSTIWSCLATQAAVYHLDSIERRALGAKLSGVFDCSKCEHHDILEGCPSNWTVPHSRYNDLPEDLLISSGYGILTRLSNAGADIFVKQRKGLHYFLQGHMEYDGDVLSREYRRDVKRFLAEESDRYPDVPTGYLSPDVTMALLDFRQNALRNRCPDMFAQLPLQVGIASQKNPWRPIATRFYQNWLGQLAHNKIAETKPTTSRIRQPGHDKIGWNVQEGQ